MLTAGAAAEDVVKYLNRVVTARMELTGNPAQGREIAERATAIYAQAD